MGTNFVMVSGEIGHPPEVRGSGDRKTVNFVVPVDEFWIDKKTGQEMKHTEWMRCVVFDRNAQISVERLKKGTTVICKGSNRTDTFVDKDKSTQTRTKIVCGEIVIMDGVSAAPIVFSELDDAQNIPAIPPIQVPASNPVLHSSQVVVLASRLVSFLRSFRSVTSTS